MYALSKRPEATACAGTEIWNENMNCGVNKGAKGIALIDEEADKPRLKYIFDMEDADNWNSRVVFFCDNMKIRVYNA